MLDTDDKILDEAADLDLGAMLDSHELAVVDYRIAQHQARIQRLRNRSLAILSFSFVWSLIGGTIVSFGNSLPFFGPESRPQIIGVIFLLYGVAGGGSIFFMLQSQKAKALADIDLLVSRRGLLSRIGNGNGGSGGRAEESYFDRLVKINIRNLEAYYDLVKNHTENSFFISIISGVVGFLLILTGLILGFNDNLNTHVTGYVASASGLITEFIAGIFFYLYNKTIHQLKSYHDSLLDVQNILLSFKIVGDMTDSADKTRMMNQMLTCLVGKANGEASATSLRQH